MELRAARDQLFAASLERFVALRTELAGELAREGRKEDSRALKAIHRPSISAWTTNQVVRHASTEVDAFLEASDHLRRAQHDMLSGQTERATYLALSEVFREATTALGSVIRRVLADGARNADPSLVERVLSNFRNAAISEGRRTDLLHGQLENDVAVDDDHLANLFGAAPGGAVPRGATSPSPGVPPVVATDRREQARRQREEQALAHKEELLRRLQAARDDEAALGQRETAAQSGVTQARAACDQAREQLDEADRAATHARQTWRDAQTTLHRAEREATETRAALQSATQRRETAEHKAR